MKSQTIPWQPEKYVLPLQIPTVSLDRPYQYLTAAVVMLFRKMETKDFIWNSWKDIPNRKATDYKIGCDAFMPS